MNNSNPLIKMRDIDKDLTPVERRLAEYILANPHKISSMSVRELAEAGGASDASVLRFCKTLGYSGYRSFIIDLTLAAADEKKSGNQYTDIRPGDSVETIIQNVFRSEKQALNDTKSVLDKKEVSTAVSLLRNSKTVHFFGTGASGLVCLDAQQKFRRIGIHCFAHTEAHDQITSAVLLGEEDISVLFTYSGNTKEIQKVFQILKSQNCKTIIVTKFRKTNLLTGADAYLNVLTPEVTMRSGAMGSRIAMLAIVDILLSSILSIDYEKYEHKLLKTYKVLREN